jgi:hypothetical protein
MADILQKSKQINAIGLGFGMENHCFNRFAPISRKLKPHVRSLFSSPL